MPHHILPKNTGGENLRLHSLLAQTYYATIAQSGRQNCQRLHSKVNQDGDMEMQSLHEINSILTSQDEKYLPKRVTFVEPIPESRVPAHKTNTAYVSPPKPWTLLWVTDTIIDKLIGAPADLRSNIHP